MARYFLQFGIYELPLTTNAQTSMHWTARSKYVKRWHELVAAHVGAKKPAIPLWKVKLTLVRFSSREPDFDGLVSTFKPVIDGLIKCGVIVNDKVSNVGQPIYSWQKVSPKQGKIYVCVEEDLDGTGDSGIRYPGGRFPGEGSAE